MLAAPYQFALDLPGPICDLPGKWKLLIERTPISSNGVELGEIPGTVTDLKIDHRDCGERAFVVQTLQGDPHLRGAGNASKCALVDQKEAGHRQTSTMTPSSARSGPPALLTSLRRRSAFRSA